MAERFINIEFPFKDDSKGNFLQLNTISERAIRSDLIHLLMTNKGERLYLPDFGTNLRQYLFEPNLPDVHGKIKEEIQASVSKYIPNLIIDKLELLNIDPDDVTIEETITTTSGTAGTIRDEHHVLVTIDYTVTIDSFKSSDTLQIRL